MKYLQLVAEVLVKEEDKEVIFISELPITHVQRRQNLCNLKSNCFQQYNVIQNARASIESKRTNLA